MISRLAQPTVTYGYRAIGLMATMDTIGSQDTGLTPPKLASSGRRAIGVTPEGFTSGMPVTGDLMLGFMGA